MTRVFVGVEKNIKNVVRVNYDCFFKKQIDKMELGLNEKEITGNGNK